MKAQEATNPAENRVCSCKGVCEMMHACLTHFGPKKKPTQIDVSHLSLKCKTMNKVPVCVSSNFAFWSLDSSFSVSSDSSGAA